MQKRFTGLRILDEPHSARLPPPFRCFAPEPRLAALGGGASTIVLAAPLPPRCDGCAWDKRPKVPRPSKLATRAKTRAPRKIHLVTSARVNAPPPRRRRGEARRSGDGNMARQNAKSLVPFKRSEKTSYCPVNHADFPVRSTGTAPRLRLGKRRVYPRPVW